MSQEELRDKMKKIEWEVYWRMCRDCPNAHACHNNCENCEEYEEELEKDLNDHE